MNPGLGLARLGALLRPSDPGPFLDSVRAWLLEFDRVGFLQAFPWSGEISPYTTGRVHLGFVLYPGLRDGWSEHLQKAGFQAEQPFQSQVLAREMSQWHAGRPVGCQVQRAWCSQDRGLEGFFPDLSDSEVEPWIVGGRGCHLGLELKHSKHLQRALECCRRGGFQVADFLAGQPARNSVQNIQVIYADGDWDGCPLRLEFYASEARCSASA